MSNAGFRIWALVVSAAALVGSGCGGDGADRGEPEAQPVAGGSTFEEGNFDQLPRYPGTNPASDPAVEDDVTSQSFEVEAATPAQVIQYFTDELASAGWTVVEPPSQIGAERTHRGVWRRGDQQLVVSTTEFSGYDDPSGERITQYSLSLGPA